MSQVVLFLCFVQCCDGFRQFWFDMIYLCVGLSSIITPKFFLFKSCLRIDTPQLQFFPKRNRNSLSGPLILSVGNTLILRAALSCIVSNSFVSNTLPLSFLPGADPQGPASDPVRRQAFQLGHSHRHRVLPPLLGQLACDLGAVHPRHLRPDRYVHAGQTTRFALQNDIICALCNHLLLHPSGATSAPSLIFILPGIFYIRIVPEEQEPLLSRTKITVQL